MVKVRICRDYDVSAVCLEFLSVEALTRARPWVRSCWRCGLPVSKWIGDYVALVTIHEDVGGDDRIVCDRCGRQLIDLGAKKVDRPKGVLS